jgi:hypothetical protein
MSMDIRFPIGFMFTLTGLIITIWGFVSGPEIYKKSLNVNINLWTGGAMLIFGIAFLALGLSAQARNKKKQPTKSGH